MFIYLPTIRKRGYTNTNPFWLIPLVVFSMVSALPANALSFEHTLPVSPAEELVIRWNDRGVEETVALALNTLPAYTSLSTGSVVSSGSPVTIKAYWPKAYTAPLITTPSSPQSKSVVLIGEASYYSRAGCLGCNPRRIMANGQPLNDNAFTMAIGADKKHLVGRTAKVTNVVTGQSVEVRITDTGGFYQAKYGHRVADLTVATKHAIGIQGGTGQVKVEVY